MTLNPYEPPGAHSTRESLPNDSRRQALRSLRIGLLIFAIPTFYNLASYYSLPQPMGPAVSLLNLVHLLEYGATALVGIAIWFAGLHMLERVASLIRTLLAPGIQTNQWLAVLHKHVGRIPRFAAAGALIWTVWIFGFYQLKINFYAISVPLGAAGHLLAAGLYLPLIVDWYRLRKRSGEASND